MNPFNPIKIASGTILIGCLAGYGLSAAAAPTCPENLDPAADYNCVFFNVGTDFNSDTDSITSAFYEFGYNSTLSTSIYTASPSGTIPLGSPVYDTNIKQIINYYGLSGGPTNYTAIDGFTSQSLKDAPVFPGEQNVDTLSGPGAPPDTEFFDANNTFGGIGWGLTYNYFFEGTWTATGPRFTSGYIDFFFQNWVNGTSEQVLRVNVTDSNLTLGNLDIFGEVTFDWTGGGNDIYGLPTLPDGTNDCTTPLCQNFFNFLTSTPTSFFSLVNGGKTIRMKLDTNISPAIPTSSQLVEFTGMDSNKYWIRQTTLDGSVRFIPEPASLLLLGGGLLALGVLRRKETKTA